METSSTPARPEDYLPRPATKHTPEPWIVEEADNGGERHNIYSDNPAHDGAYIAAVWSDESATGNDGADEDTPQYVTDAEADANAKRIVACVNGCAGIADPSAVGDMLEALRAILAADVDYISAAVDLEPARAVVARATGNVA